MYCPCHSNNNNNIQLLCPVTKANDKNNNNTSATIQNFLPMEDNIVKSFKNTVSTMLIFPQGGAMGGGREGVWAKEDILRTIDKYGLLAIFGIS